MENIFGVGFVIVFLSGDSFLFRPVEVQGRLKLSFLCSLLKVLSGVQ